MISLDKYVVDFVGQNWVTLGLVLGLAKTIAVESKNNIDNKIVTWFGNALTGLRGGTNLPPGGGPGPAPSGSPTDTGGSP